MKLAELIKKGAVGVHHASAPAQVLFGIVTKTNPLEITTEQKLKLSKEFLVLCREVTDYEVEMTVDHLTENQGGGSGEASFSAHHHAYKGRKKFIVHKALKMGEEVVLIRQQGGQEYLVIDRRAK